MRGKNPHTHGSSWEFTLSPKTKQAYADYWTLPTLILQMDEKSNDQFSQNNHSFLNTWLRCSLVEGLEINNNGCEIIPFIKVYGARCSSKSSWSYCFYWLLCSYVPSKHGGLGVLLVIVFLCSSWLAQSYVPLDHHVHFPFFFFLFLFNTSMYQQVHFTFQSHKALGELSKCIWKEPYVYKYLAFLHIP